MNWHFATHGHKLPKIYDLTSSQQHASLSVPQETCSRQRQNNFGKRKLKREDFSSRAFLWG